MKLNKKGEGLAGFIILFIFSCIAYFLVGYPVISPLIEGLMSSQTDPIIIFLSGFVVFIPIIMMLYTAYKWSNNTYGGSGGI